MSRSIQPLSTVKLGLVPTYLRFAGGLAPNERGKLPRDDNGDLLLSSRLKPLIRCSPVPVEVVQFPLFDGVDVGEMQQLVSVFDAMGVETQLILMLGGGNPMEAADEERFVSAAKSAARLAIQLGVVHVAATSLENWMQPGAKRREAADYEAAVAQLARVHRRIYQEAVADSCIRAWHIEFLRKGEFSTFTDLGRAWDVVRRANTDIDRPFFKVLIDAAHCGDSDLSIEENAALIAGIAEADALGIFHASAKTTRGCLSTDDGWIAALLAACAGTGKLDYALVEVFDHQDEALAELRALDPRHGIDTRDGRTYDEVVIDALTDVARRLNNLTQRGVLPRRHYTA